MEFLAEFPDDATCLDWLWRNRYSEDGEHAHCPKCDQVRAFKKYVTKQRRQSWTCTACGWHLHPTAGTIFHKSSTSLKLWFYAIYLMSSTRCGLSAKQLEREIGVNYKTALRMLRQIRTYLMAQDDDQRLSGEVEADETWVGGKLREGERKRLAAEARARGKRKPSGQYVKDRASVFAMVERGGEVRAQVMREKRYGYPLRNTLKTFVLKGSTVYTDEAGGYTGIEERFNHRRINHSQRIYVSGNVHTQTIEGFFGLVKNGIRGTYHSVSKKHLQTYLNEFVWRYNHHDDDRAQFATLLVNALTTP
jgi:transposase-like protein